MKPRFLAFPLTVILASSAVAGDYIWRGTSNSTWTDSANWDITTTPPTATADSSVVYGKDYPTDRLNIGNGLNFGAVYDPGSPVTTTFRSGRGLVIGSGAGNTANLTVTSGTIAVINLGGGGQEPLMANGTSANLLINGGAIDLTGTSLKFILVNSGVAGLTSTLTMTSGAFSCAGFEFFQGGTLGTSTVNLDGGVMSLSRFLKTQTNTASALNLDSGTLRLRSTQTTSPNFTLPDLVGLTTTVKDGGVVVDTNSFNGTFAEVLEHDATLGATPDGGLTKNSPGNLTLSGTNTFTGPVKINAGTALATPSRIILSNNSGAGLGPITMADSFTEIQVNNTRNIPNAITISDNGDTKELLLPAPGFAAATFSGPITINETNIDNFRARADDNCFLTFSGIVSGPGGIFKYQPGRLDLTNPLNDFSGDVKITHGAVSFTSGALGTTGLIRMEGTPAINGVTLRWDPTNDQDISSRLRMYDGKAATLVLADGGTPFDISNVIFASAIGDSTTASLVKSGNGILTLTQPSTYSGGTTVTQGTLEFPNNGLGTTGSVTMNGGILRWGPLNTQDISSRIVMVDAKAAAISTNGNDVTFATPIGNSSTGSLSKTNTAGTLTLSGINTYTGTTTVGGGTLKLGATASITASASVTIGAGATLDTSDQSSYAVPVAQPVVFAVNATGSGSAGKIAAAGLDVSTATVTYSITGTPDDPVYILATYTGTLGGTFASVPAPPAGYSLNYAFEGNKIALVQSAVTGYAAWQAANGGIGTGNLDDDHDNDGVDNGTEYFLFGNTNSTGFTALPGVTNTAGVLSVTWTKAATGYAGTYGTDFSVENSATLGNPWTAAALGVLPGQVDISGNQVKYTFPAGTLNFARLKVTGP